VARRRPLRHVTFTLGAGLTLVLIATALLSLVYTPADPLAMSITGRLQGPSGGHPFGTDQFGRDILSRVMTGAVTSIAVGIIAVGIGVGAGLVLGLVSGYAGGWLDEVLMRLVDAVQGFPAILSALLFTAVFSPGMLVSMTAIGIAFVPAFARITRGSVLELREREFVVAARALGGGDARLLVRHILPNSLAPLIVQATTSFPVAILAEAALAYLPVDEPVVRGLPGRRDRSDRAWSELSRRWPARPAGSPNRVASLPKNGPVAIFDNRVKVTVS
jgi:peptide/nickel transport system permease protein